MNKKIIRLTESDLHNIINRSIKKIIKENMNDEFYNEEDYDGNVGRKGMVKSYDIGYYTVDQAKQDAQENGYDNLSDYLKFWFNEIQQECPWTWEKLGNGYGFNGKTIFDENGVRCKDIFGQIIIDEYPR